MCLIKQLRMFRPKITKMRAIKQAMPLIPNSPCGAECASAHMPGHSRPAKPAQLAGHPEMENGHELFDRKREEK